MQIAKALAGLTALLCLVGCIQQPNGEGRLLSLLAGIGALFTVYLCKTPAHRLR